MYPKYITKDRNSLRIRIRLKNKRIVKFISIAKFASEAQALKEAIKQRNKILKQHDLLSRLKYKKAPDRFTNKNIIVIGINFSKHYKKNGKLFTNWVAHCRTKQGKDIKKSFSVNKYGYENAFLKACELRYKHCGTLIIVNKKTLPCIPNVPHKFLENG